MNRNLAQDEIHNKYPQKNNIIFKIIISRWSDPSQDTIPNFQKQANNFPTQKCCEFFVLVGLYDNSESRKWRSKPSHSLRCLEMPKKYWQADISGNFSWWFQNHGSCPQGRARNNQSWKPPSSSDLFQYKAPFFFFIIIFIVLGGHKTTMKSDLRCLEFHKTKPQPSGPTCLMVWEIKQNAKHAGQRHLMHSYPFHHIWWWYLMHISTFDDIWCICPHLMISDAHVHLMQLMIQAWFLQHSFRTFKGSICSKLIDSFTLLDFARTSRLLSSRTLRSNNRLEARLWAWWNPWSAPSKQSNWTLATQLKERAFGTVAANHWFIRKTSRVDYQGLIVPRRYHHFPYDVLLFEEDRSVCWSMLNQTSQSSFLSSTSNNTFWSHCAWQNSQPFEDSQPRSMSFGPIHS